MKEKHESLIKAGQLQSNKRFHYESAYPVDSLSLIIKIPDVKTSATKSKKYG